MILGSRLFLHRTERERINWFIVTDYQRGILDPLRTPETGTCPSIVIRSSYGTHNERSDGGPKVDENAG